MNWITFGKEKAPTLLLIPGLGVSYEIFLPLIRLLEERFRIIAVEVDGFTLGKPTLFTSVDDQAAQVIAYVQNHHDGHLDCAYGLSLGGKILSRVLEREEITIDHAILDAAPLLPLPRWLVGPLRHYQAFNVWTCYRWTKFWRCRAGWSDRCATIRHSTCGPATVGRSFGDGCSIPIILTCC